jgi:hypothetical protein
LVANDEREKKQSYKKKMSTPDIQKTSSLIEASTGIAIFATIILCVMGALVWWQFTELQNAGWKDKSQEATWIALVTLATLGFVFSLIYWIILGSQNATVQKYANKTKAYLGNLWDRGVAAARPYLPSIELPTF